MRRTLRDRIDEWLKLTYRHDVLVGRAVRGLQLEAAALFDREVTRPLLVEVAGRLGGAQLRTGNLVRDLMPELVGLRTEIERVVHRGSDAIRRVTETRMEEIARGEVRWAETAARRVLGDEFAAGVQGRFGDGVPAQAVRSVRENTWLGDSTEKWFEKLLDRPTADKARAWVTTGVQQGLTIDEITRGLAGTKTQTGILDTGRVAARALARTSATHATTVSRTESFRALGVGYWRFLATLDQRTSLQCASEDGNIYPLGEGPVPPLHPNCLPGDSLVSTAGAIAGVAKRWFDGEVCVIRTASGRVLTGTPNHPVLTDRGWVAIGALAEGDNVVCDGGSQWGGVVDGDNENVPTAIHEVAEAFFASGDVASVPMPVSSPHFHGDAADGQVAVVGADRRLRPELHAAIAEHRRQLDLVGADHLGLTQGSARQLLMGMPLATDCVVSGTGEPGALLGAGSAHSRELLLGSVAEMPAVLGECSGKRRSAIHAELSGDGNGADAGIVQIDGDRRLGIVEIATAATDLGTGTMDGSVGTRLADAELAREILDGGSGPVFLDELVEVGRKRFAGHVYNLETTLGFYTANGIVTHNCRSVMVPAFSEDDEPVGKRASIKGQVPASTTFEEWVETIPRAEQDRYFGKTKAAAWRAGKLTLKDMLGRDMEPLTLAELRDLDRL
jgi:SPP1 gp7 family putative phage head morphogenesis protein